MLRRGEVHPIAYLLTTLIPAITNADEMLIDIPSIAGKTKAQVSDLIGKPLSCSDSKYGEKCQYKVGETEIIFIQGKADWITVEGLDDMAFDEKTLSALGLPSKKPTFVNPYRKRWELHNGLKSVSRFKGSSNADYAYIKAFTK